MSTVADSTRWACESTYCTTIGDYWGGRIVLVGRPRRPIVGRCDSCHLLFCHACAWPVEVPPGTWPELGIPVTAGSPGQVPVLLHCKRCGTVLRSAVSDRALVLTAEPAIGPLRS
jgi:hypothetical protein